MNRVRRQLDEMEREKKKKSKGRGEMEGKKVMSERKKMGKSPSASDQGRGLKGEKF
jgi:hypothetical protein